MRIESIEFKNYKLLRDATLPLEPLTVIVGANGSGKSSVLEALGRLDHIGSGRNTIVDRARSLGREPERDPVEVRLRSLLRQDLVEFTWSSGTYDGVTGNLYTPPLNGAVTPQVAGDTAEVALLMYALGSFRSFALAPERLRSPSQSSEAAAALAADGATLAATLDQMRDRNPDALDAVNAELGRWLPEYDRVLFETPQPGFKSVALRTRVGRYRVSAQQLSAGTLLALGLLTIVHNDLEPRIFGLEEPEVGIHPRLLRNVFDALLRVAYPAENGIDRQPRQVIVTTHSPYFLDLFKDHPECVVIADRHEDSVTFSRLSDHPDADRIVMAAPLGESWFTGVLGGVPAGPTPPTVYPVGAAAA